MLDIGCEAQNTLGAKSRDGRGINTSDRDNSMSRTAYIKHNEDTVLSNLRERGSYNNNG